MIVEDAILILVQCKFDIFITLHKTTMQEQIFINCKFI